MQRIKVIVIDDSAVVRQVNRETLERQADIEVIAVCPDPLVAFEKMQQQWPDVIVTDIEMPRMDGLAFLRRIMAERPTPVVVCSSLTDSAAATTVQALAAGALAIITKPKLRVRQFLLDSGNDLVAAVRAAARADMARVRHDASRPRQPAGPRHVERIAAPAHDLGTRQPSAVALPETTEKVIAIGTSTGGTQALETVLTALPRTTAGIVVVQHMPETFTSMLAYRLNELCAMEVREARDGDRVLPGRVLIAPGGRHMMLQRNGAQYGVLVTDGPPVNRHKPSVDVLFRSVARAAGGNALGIIMTGMGDDGARGIREMRKARAQTIAEHESTCVVFGMPKAAIDLGGVGKIVPLDHIAQEIVAYGR